MPHFVKGVVKFQNDVYPKKKKLFEELSHGQSPEALFITCSDSRIEIPMLTQTQPGDLFICRTAGNIVPPHFQQGTGVTASIEYAVSVLDVPHIVVCGHTDCGAMKGLLNPDGLDDLPSVKQWLGNASAAIEAVEAAAAGQPDEARLRMLLEQNVLLQVEHLKTHPSVAERLSGNRLTLHGWIYDIRTGDVWALDADAGAFVPFEERYGAG